MSIIADVLQEALGKNHNSLEMIKFAVARTLQLQHGADVAARASHMKECEAYFNVHRYAVVHGTLGRGVKHVYGPFDSKELDLCIREIVDKYPPGTVSTHKIQGVDSQTPTRDIKLVTLEIDHRGVIGVRNVTDSPEDPTGPERFPLETWF